MRRIYLKNLPYVMVLLCGALFFGFDRIPDWLKAYVKLNDLVGFSIISLGTIIFSIHHELISLMRGPRSLWRSDNLGATLTSVLGRYSRIRELRVMAHTSENILPSVRDSAKGRGLSIEKAWIFLQKVDRTSQPAIHDSVEHMLEGWRDKHMNIKSLMISSFEGTRTIYCVVINNDVAILGYYHTIPGHENRANFLPPVVIEAHDKDGMAAVGQLVHWFDQEHEAWSKRTETQVSSPKSE